MTAWCFTAVASNYLCDLPLGSHVDVVGPFGATFLMADDPDADIVMICTGTGAAPFRGFTERRRRTGSSGRGKLHLFFGARTAGELPYFGPLQKVPAEVAGSGVGLLTPTRRFARVCARPDAHPRRRPGRVDETRHDAYLYLRAARIGGRCRAGDDRHRPAVRRGLAGVARGPCGRPGDITPRRIDPRAAQ